MRSLNHTRPPSSSSRRIPDSVAGSIALLALLGAALVAVSYPWLTVAALAGAVGATSLRRGLDAVRRRRSRTASTGSRGRDAPESGSDAVVASPPKR